MGYTILVVDDSKAILSNIQQICDSHQTGYNLLFASNGKDACEIAKNKLPDLILMDLIMPVMTGIEAIKFLKRNKSTVHIPIVLLTASNSIEEAFNAGADDFITKPFHAYELLIRIRLSLSLVERLKKIKRQNEILEKQKEKLHKQNELVESQKKDIIDDIRYSKRIQNAILPTDDLIHSMLDEWFILNLPRNIVSGDFYWVGKNNGNYIVIVGDCTGHGISGAFMTVAAVSFLNEINLIQRNLQASEILTILKDKVIKFLHQKDEGNISDGIDLALCLMDLKNYNLQFSGANNPLYIIRDNELIEIKGDRIPIGIYVDIIKDFTNHEFKLQKKDRLYMFSDGYADQFGGPFNKKFRYRQLKETLLKIHTKPMAEQKELLKKKILEWKGNEMQIDDIIVMGIEIK